MVMKEILIYALPKGETERYMESLLSTQCKTPEEIEKMKRRAAADGWHSFRVTTWDGSPPDFLKAIG